ncbi:MAG: MGMT family protein [Nanoarchaeota archaeon]
MPFSICQQIPKGKVTTYKEIASVLGTKGYQAIGQALQCNPYAPHVPCHRVVKSDGSLGGFKGKTSGKEL